MQNSVTSQQLLTSGLLEAYLLGLTTEADRSDIQELMAQNPALFRQLDALDADIEAHFREVAVPPPPAIRDLIELRTTEPQLPQRTNDTDFNQHTTYREQAHKTN